MSDSLNLSVVETIILDIDDTLNSLTMTIMGSIFGCPVGPYDYDKFPTKVGYEIIEAVRLMTGREWSVGEFWDSVPRELWATAPLSKECEWLLERSVELVGEQNVFLASTPTKDPDAHAGKVEWINAFMPDWIHRQYFITPRKSLLANSQTLLIDDHDGNIERFREMGGQGLIVPRPWNHANELDTKEFLSQQLGECWV